MFFLFESYREIDGLFFKCYNWALKIHLKVTEVEPSATERSTVQKYIV